MSSTEEVQQKRLSVRLLEEAGEVQTKLEELTKMSVSPVSDFDCLMRTLHINRLTQLRVSAELAHEIEKVQRLLRVD